MLSVGRLTFNYINTLFKSLKIRFKSFKKKEKGRTKTTVNKDRINRDKRNKKLKKKKTKDESSIIKRWNMKIV